MTAQPPDGPQQWPPSDPASDAPSNGDPAPSPGADAPFDPYRFGPPAHPIDPAYAPPGYVPPPAAPPISAAPPAPAYGGQQFPAGPGGYPTPGYQPPPPYGQAPYGQAPYGQAPYGQAPYAQAPYGQPQFGQAPYGQAPYGAPPNPYAMMQRQTNGLAVTALVLGIVALVLSWIPVFDGLVIVPAIVFGIIGINAAKRRGGIGKTMAIIGLCLSLAATVICIAWSAYVFSNCKTTTDTFGDQHFSCSFNSSDPNQD